jgi:outer membrane protein OmpA-like peptidoglycan-associated protein
MLPINKKIQTSAICILMVLLTASAAKAQVTPPTWWFGVSGAANFNFYGGTTQTLNNSLIVPTAFHRGQGVRPYGSVLVEYRPAGVFGLILNVAYDGRGAKFNNEVAPCDCPATLETKLSYLAIEPSLRLSVPTTGLYFFLGPRIAFNISKEFEYTQLRQPNTTSDLSGVHSNLVSGQVGMGYDIMLSPATSVTKVSLSPFVSFHPYFGQEPRDIESWTVTTFRAGLALKIGKGHRTEPKMMPPPVMVVIPTDVNFTVRTPIAKPVKLQVSETMPLRSAVFFDAGSTEIPGRYVMLSKDQATSFREDQLQNEQTATVSGRSTRQLNIYHNILNIIGDRLRANPTATISLNGASDKGIAEGKAYATSVKQYLVTQFGIDAARIAVSGSLKPAIPSEKPGGTKELELLRADDRRVDIESTSPELLAEVGADRIKPITIMTTQVDPMDSHLVFNVDSATTKLKTWSVDITDDKGTAQHYGPFTSNQESVAASTILAGNAEGNYKVVMTGQTLKDQTVTKETKVHLVRQDDTFQKGLRYSILLNFDQANAVDKYNKFLTDIVAPSITDGETVVIQGHTDIIGEPGHNLKLSQERAEEVQNILQKALTSAGKTNVKFETRGFGADASHQPFENSTPEERFYNRTVIIDITPVK